MGGRPTKARLELRDEMAAIVLAERDEAVRRYERLDADHERLRKDYRALWIDYEAVRRELTAARVTLQRGLVTLLARRAGR